MLVDSSTKELIIELQRNHKSSKGFLGVNLDGVNTMDDLFENVLDEILSINEVVENSDIEDEFGMSVREAKGYIKKLKSFILKYAPESFHR